MQGSTSVSIRDYVIKFGIYFTGTALLVVFSAVLLEIDFGSGMRLITTMCSGIGVASLFVRNEWRAPNKQEKFRLSCWCTVVTVVSSLLFLLATNFLAQGGGFVESLLSLQRVLRVFLWIMLFLVDGVLSFLILYLIYGMYSRKLANKLQIHRASPSIRA